VIVKVEAKLHDWATPFAIGAFCVSAITGIMLFFKVDLALIKPFHEWMSWVLLIGVVLHLVVNWRPFMQHVLSPVSRSIIAAFLLLICFSMVPLDDKRGGHPFHRVTDNIVQAPLGTVAQVAKHTPDEAIEMLRLKGINVEGKEQTVQDIALKNKKSPIDVLDIIF
jgi:hypothetical protein